MRMLLARLTTLVAAVAATVGCGVTELVHEMNHQVQGTGPLQKQSRTPGSFQSVQVGGAFEVDLRKGSRPSVTVEAQQSLLKHIETTVEGGQLIVRMNGSVNTDKPMRLTIVTPSLKALDLSGACSLKSDAWKAPSFKLDLSGASRATLALDVDRLDADLSGASDVELRGSADRLELDLSGASNFKANDLRVGDAKVGASEASHASLRVSGTLSGDASGASNIRLRSNPRAVQVETSGAASVERE